jgi:chromosome partitioning protein
VSEVLELERPAMAAQTCRIVVVCSPKGGTGKTSVARNLLVAASQNDVRAVGIDFDKQASLLKWSERRVKTRQNYPNFVPVEVVSSRLIEWQTSLTQVQPYSVAIIDTPPTVEDDLASIVALCRAAHFVIVPSSASSDDLDSVLPWMRTLAKTAVKAAFIMNRVNRTTKSFTAERAKLIQIGPVCPVEIPSLEDMHTNTPVGLSMLDFTKSRGLEPMEGVWAFVRREAGL